MSAEAVGPWESTSAETDKVIAAFTSALGMLADITKDRSADMGTFKVKYADLAAATSATRPVLASVGLAVTQGVTADGSEVLVRTTVMHTSGQWLCYRPLGMPAGKTAQSAGSAATYGRRYSLMGALGLATEDDDGAGAGRRDDTPAREPEPTFSKEAVDLASELDSYRGTPVAEALMALAVKHSRRMKVADLEDAAWRQDILNTIDAAKADADMIAGGEKP